MYDFVAEAYARADGKCMICGAPVKRLEAHERWTYDEENEIQRIYTVVKPVDVGKIVPAVALYALRLFLGCIDGRCKLNFELVPDSCWYSNLRSILSPAQWDVVRREAKIFL